MASKKENHMDNRAWFMQEDGRFPQTLYVMYDKNKNGLIQVTFMHAQFFNPKEIQMCTIGVNRGKAFNGEDFKALIYNVEPGKYSTKEYILQWDFLPNSSNIPLANERALKVLYEIAPGEFQEIPTQIILPSGEVLENYKLINVLNRVDGIDFENSVLSPRYKGDSTKARWSDYKEVYFKPNMLGNTSIARTKDMFTSEVIVSTKLKDAIKEQKITGMVFKIDTGGISRFLDI
jgi:hypothetical protein